MTIRIESFTGKNGEPYLQELAKLRIEVFREYPYLYEGSLVYEKEYLKSFLDTDGVILVVAFDGDEVVGVSTGMPLIAQLKPVQQPWLDNKEDVSRIFYLSESVLKKTFRGRGIGVQFFEAREAWAIQQGFAGATFCGVVRPTNDPWRPMNWVPLDQFWLNRGYLRKDNYLCHMHWQMVYEREETEKTLQFWFKELLPSPSSVAL